MTCELPRQETDHSVTTHTPTQVTTIRSWLGESNTFLAAFSEGLWVAEAGNRPFGYNPRSYTSQHRQQLIGSKLTNFRQDFSNELFGLKMGRRCTAGGFAVIPEQARQYGPFKGFFALCGMLGLGTWRYCDLWQYYVMGRQCTAGGFAVIPEQVRQEIRHFESFNSLWYTVFGHFTVLRIKMVKWVMKILS